MKRIRVRGQKKVPIRAVSKYGFGAKSRYLAGTVTCVTSDRLKFSGFVLLLCSTKIHASCIFLLALGYKKTSIHYVCKYLTTTGVVKLVNIHCAYTPVYVCIYTNINTLVCVHAHLNTHCDTAHGHGPTVTVMDCLFWQHIT
jgi:hypothetical protein